MKKILITLLFFPLIGSDLSESHKRSFDEIAAEVDISDILDHVGPLDEGDFNLDPDAPFHKLLGISAEDIIFYPLDADCWIDSINRQPLDLGVARIAAKRHKKSYPE